MTVYYVGMTYIKMKKSTQFLLLFLIGSIVYITTVVLPQLAFIRNRQETIYYGFFNTIAHDYSHYTSIIRNGIEEGGLLFHNQFSDPWKPDVLYMPFYKVLGIVGGLLGVHQFLLYFLARNFFSLLLVLAMIAFVCAVFKQFRERAAALILSLTATSVWYLTNCGTMNCPVFAETYARHHLNASYRLLLLPPHHYLAMIFFLLTMVLFSRYKKTLVWMILYATSCILMALLHPYYALMWLLILALFITLSLFQERERIRDFIVLFLFTCGFVLPVEYLTHKSYEIMVGYRPLVVENVAFPLPLTNYVLATGFIIIPFIISMIFFRTWQHNRLLRLCLCWFFAPFIAFVTPYINQIMSFYRLFQIMPQIPAGIFSVAIFVFLYKRWKRVANIFLAGTLLFFSLYHLGFVYFQIPYLYSENIPEFYNYQLFQQLQEPVSYLRKVTKSSDVVLAGERIAPMIPSLINVHVINGHEGDTDRFEERVTNTRIFFYGAFDEKQVKEFFRTYQISYIIYGFDSLPFEQSPYKNYSFLEEVYKNGSLSIVKVGNF